MPQNPRTTPLPSFIAAGPETVTRTVAMGTDPGDHFAATPG